MKKPVKKLPKAQDGKIQLNANKMSKGVKDGIELLQKGKEQDYEKFGSILSKLNKAQQDSVSKFQRAKLIYKKVGGSVKTKRK